MTEIHEQKCVMIIAGEESGDLHGAKLVRAMREKNHDLFFCGIGGNALKKEGVRILVKASELAVVGITEVLSKLPDLIRGMGLVKKALKSLKPDLLILIDFPDFNLHAASHAKKNGIPVLYYISPQIWAWRPGRVKKIGRLVDHMAVILPFEEVLYRKHNIPVTFVGHPLLDSALTLTENLSSGDHKNEHVIGLLPGSRDKEILRLLPVMLASAEELYKKNNKLKFMLSIASSIDEEMVYETVQKYSKAVKYEFISESVKKIFEKCSFVIAASGTVTLEAALAGIPMLIIYRVSSITYLLGKLLTKIKHISLVNLIAGEEVVPELLQDDVSSANIAETAHRMINDTGEFEKIKEKLIELRKILGGPGASERLAEIAVRMIQ